MNNFIKILFILLITTSCTSTVGGNDVPVYSIDKYYAPMTTIESSEIIEIKLTEIVEALELSLKHILPEAIQYDEIGSVYITSPSQMEQLNNSAEELQKQADAAKQLIEDVRVIQKVLDKCKEIIKIIESEE